VEEEEVELFMIQVIQQYQEELEDQVEVEQEEQLIVYLQQYQEQQEQLILEVEQVEVLVIQEQVELVDQELLLLVKDVDHQLTTLLPESGQLMTHIITRKLERGQTLDPYQ
jgi:hypothetical protein